MEHHSESLHCPCYDKVASRLDQTIWPFVPPKRLTVSLCNRFLGKLPGTIRSAMYDSLGLWLRLSFLRPESYTTMTSMTF